MERESKNNTREQLDHIYSIQGTKISPIRFTRRDTINSLYRIIGIPASHIIKIAITDNEKISNVYFNRLTKAPVCFITHIGVKDVTYEYLRDLCSHTDVEWPETYNKRQMNKMLNDGLEYANIDVAGLRVLIPDIKEFLDGYYSRSANQIFLFSDDGYLEEFSDGKYIYAYAFDALREEVEYEIHATSEGIVLEPIIKPSCKKMLLVTLVHRNTYLSLPDEYTRVRCPEFQIEGLADSDGNTVSIAPNTCVTYNGMITGDDTPVIYNLNYKVPRLKS